MSWILHPFQLLLAAVFENSLALIGSEGVSLLLLSLFVTLFLSPVQVFINWMRKKNAPVKDRMSAVEEEIERSYQGQTRHLYLRTLYRQHGYHPINNFIPLSLPLLQIPFFLAAYGYLSALNVFSQKSFLVIPDLSRPDGLISLGGLSLNLLPLLMTLVNLLNVELMVTDKRGNKSSLRYLAIAFLLLLYRMPSALVFYWFMNNVWLLVINLIKDPSGLGLVGAWRQLTAPLMQWKSHRREIAFILLLLTAYLGLRMYLSPTDSSLSYIWSQRLGLLALLMGSGLGISEVFSKNRPGSTERMPAPLVWGLFCLSTFPVVHYAYVNEVFLSGRFLLELAGYLLAPVIILLFSARFLLSRFFKDNSFLVLIAAFALTFFLTPLCLNVFKARLEEGLGFELLLATVLIVLFVKLNQRDKKILALLGFILFFVSSGRLGARLFKRATSRIGLEAQSKIPDYFPKKLKKTPDIYLLIYDAYIDERMLKHFGIDNADQFKYMEEKGFKIYHDKLSLERSSLKSIGWMLAMAKPKIKERKILVGHSVFDEFLKQNGYQTYYMADDYMFRGENGNHKGHVVIPGQEANTILEGILTGEFKFELTARSNFNKHWQSMKESYFTAPSTTPRFFYAHSNYPGHTQHSGTCLPNEKELFKERLIKSNAEMRADIENILKHHPDSIIITAGDHGVYFTGDCTTMRGDWSQKITGEHIADRFGVHIGIRWPDKNFEDYDDFTYLQGVFNSVLGYLAQDKNLVSHETTGQICLRGVCASANSPISGGPDKGKMLFESF